MCVLAVDGESLAVLESLRAYSKEAT